MLNEEIIFLRTKSYLHLVLINCTIGNMYNSTTRIISVIMAELESGKNIY